MPINDAGMCYDLAEFLSVQNDDNANTAAWLDELTDKIQDLNEWQDGILGRLARLTGRIDALESKENTK